MEAGARYVSLLEKADLAIIRKDPFSSVIGHGKDRIKSGYRKEQVPPA